MRRWIWALFALSVGALTISFAVLPLAGQNNSRSYAHIADINGDTLVNSGDVHLEIDMDVTNGTGPCNPVDTTRIGTTAGGSYKVAVCITSSGAAPDGEPAAFNFELVYDDTLNTCTPGPTHSLDIDGNPIPGTDLPCSPTDTNCRDYNPDANAGTTTFTTPSMGGGYDCTAGGTNPPSCDDDTATGPGHGRAFLSCTTTGNPTLTVGDSVSSPIAEVAFNAPPGTGVDHMSLDNVGVTAPTLSTLLGCPGGPGLCFGGDDFKNVTPTPTVGAATNTPTPAPTATFTPVPTATFTPGPPTSTPTETNTPTVTNTPTITNTPTETPTPTDTSTPTNTPVATSTFTPTATSTFTPTPTIWAFIDKNLNNGDGPCDPNARDSHTTEIVGRNHELAVCLANIPTEVDSFFFTVSFNPALDQCIQRECGDDTDDPDCLDANPDANAGETTFGDSLGGDWDCNIEGVPGCSDDSQPTNTDAIQADDSLAFASILCERNTDQLNTAVDDGLTDHLALAAIDFKVLGAGTDTVTIENMEVRGPNESILGQCGEAFSDVNANTVIDEMPCIGATDSKQRQTRRAEPTDTPVPPTLTPTVVVVPTLPPPTATPLGGGVGPEIQPPGTGSGSESGGFPWAIALLGTAAITFISGSGLYLRFGRARPRS